MKTREETSQAAIRLGIVGTGVMGGNHARVAASLPGCALVGIYDTDTARAAQVASQFGADSYTSLASLCAAVDAVIVASPTVTHAEVATTCLQAGCHVLLEKPIAATVAEAEALVAFAKTSEKQLMIGHIERYNPAIAVARSLIAAGELFAFELQRLSPTPGRDRSADIIFDLMIHDIDLAYAFADAEVENVFATGHKIRCGFIDHVSTSLRFANGVTATLNASAVSQERVRTGRFFTRTAQFLVDLASRQLSIHRQGQSSFVRDDGQCYQSSQVEQILVPNREPLAIEQEHFFACIHSGDTPSTSAEGGLAALRLAQAIQEQVNAQLVAHV